MVVDADGGPVKDLTPGDRDVPPFSLGGPDDYAISPDSKEVCYTMNADPVLATSTNSDLFVVPISGGESKKITLGPGADASPQYSPDGKWLAYRSQPGLVMRAIAGGLMVLERATGRVNAMTESLDRAGGKLRLVARFQRVVLHRLRSRPPKHRDDPDGGWRQPRDCERLQHRSTTCS